MKPNADTRDELCAHLRALEEALLDPAVRRNSARVATLLSKDFLEFGSSGRIWTREQTLELLATEDYTPLMMEDFKCDWISDNVALVTHRSAPTDAQSGIKSVALRRSLWVEESGDWRVRFHQGTKTI
jgi:hypothetical protein